MAGTRSEAPTSGFTEEQRAELSSLIAEAVGSVSAPPEVDQPPGKPTVTDDEWSSMSDRHKQSFIESLVLHTLDDVKRRDKDLERDAKIAELAAGKQAPEPERPPSVWSKIQGILWGQPDER